LKCCPDGLILIVGCDIAASGAGPSAGSFAVILILVILFLAALFAWVIRKDRQ
jgi:hypothetical protein